jgi:Uma2 family endonuclease
VNLALTEINLPVRLVPSSPMGDEELMRFCAANETLRVEREPNGEILIMTPSGFQTAHLNRRICQFLGDWADADGRGLVTDSNGGYTLPDGSVRVPDAAWVANSRLQNLTEKEKAGFAPLRPDFVIELRSPTDKLADLQAKMEMWMANGVELAWLTDPIERTVTVYRQNEEPARHVDPTSVQGTHPVAGFELVLAWVWN